MNANPKFLAATAHVDAAAIQPLPNSRKVYVEGSRADLRVPMRDLEGLGLFQLTLTPHRGEAEQRLLARSAPVEEGMLQRLSRAALLEHYKEVQDRLEVIESTGGEGGGVVLAGEGEIWRLLAMGLLGFLLVETILAWRFGRR